MTLVSYKIHENATVKAKVCTVAKLGIEFFVHFNIYKKKNYAWSNVLVILDFG